jgi:contact-dependent growth inhibition (CDI) system CdiA-like toxin
VGIDRPHHHDADDAQDHPARSDGKVANASRDRPTVRSDVLRDRAEQWFRRGYATHLRETYDWRQLEESSSSCDLAGSPDRPPRMDDGTDQPAARRAEWQGPLARAEVDRVGDGIVDERQRTFPTAERRIANYLAATDGCAVVARAEDHGIRARKPDANVDGVATEFKSLRAGATDATVRGALNSGKGQAGHVVVDARGAGLAENIAWHGVRRFLGAPYSAKVDEIRVIGDDYDLRWKRG